MGGGIPIGLRFTEGLKEGGDTQMCILGKVFWLQGDSRLDGSEATVKEPCVSVSSLPTLWGSLLWGEERNMPKPRFSERVFMMSPKCG